VAELQVTAFGRIEYPTGLLDLLDKIAVFHVVSTIPLAK